MKGFSSKACLGDEFQSQNLLLYQHIGLTLKHSARLASGIAGTYSPCLRCGAA
jgi:hypothetical protein